MSRRVLHVPAEDLHIGDIVNFVSEELIINRDEVIGIARDPADGQIHLSFSSGKSCFVDASDQFRLLQDI